MITLYYHGSSVCAGQVCLVLVEKSVRLDGIYVDILCGDQFDPRPCKAHSQGGGPMLVHDGKVIVVFHCHS